MFLQCKEFAAVIWRGTLRKAGRRPSVDTETRGGHPEGADILLWLEQDDVDLWSEEAAQNHRPTEADGDAHGRRLHLNHKRNGETSKNETQLSAHFMDLHVLQWICEHYLWFSSNGVGLWGFFENILSRMELWHPSFYRQVKWRVLFPVTSLSFHFFIVLRELHYF